MNIILTRHWETEETKAKILQWHLPWKLTELWKLQAQKLAQRLKDENIDIIYTSDLARTYDTTKYISEYHKWVEVVISELLRERTFWIFDWKNKNEIWFYDKEQQERFTTPKNWETINQVIERARQFIEQLDFSKNILIVSHDDISKAIYSVLTWKSFENIKSIPKAGITIIDFKDFWNYKVKICCDNSHLQN